MALEIVHTERAYIVVDSEKWQQPSLVGITKQLQAKLANARVARDAKLGALIITEEMAELLEYLAEGIDCLAPAEDGISTPKTDKARSLAAEIREALAQEGHK